MKHKEQELIAIKEELGQMWRLVISQTEKAKAAFLHHDIELALEIVRSEKRVNAYELRVERACENYIALFNPVAIDLRLILSILKISITLERIADYAEGVAREVIDKDCIPLETTLLEELELEKMFSMILNMLTDCYAAYISENSNSSGKILLKDKKVNEIYHNSFQILENYLLENPNQVKCALRWILLIRKLERVGDHCSNIVEEIVFFLEAKVLKHRGKSE